MICSSALRGFCESFNFKPFDSQALFQYRNNIILIINNEDAQGPSGQISWQMLDSGIKTREGKTIAQGLDQLLF
jgi:hypothetical protein